MDKPKFTETPTAIKLYQGLQTWINAKKMIEGPLCRLCPEKGKKIMGDIDKRIQFFAEELVDEIEAFEKDSKIITRLH